MTGNGFNGQYTVQQFIEVIPGTGGIVTKIAAKVGCSWHTARKYIDTRPTIRQAYDDECERILDLAESVVIEKLEANDDQTAKWYLKMKGARRGYAQRRETINVDLTQLTDDQLDRIAKGDDPIDAITAPGRRRAGTETENES